MKKKILFIGIFVCLVTNFLSAQLFGPSVSVSMLKSPEKLLPEVKTLVIIDFEVEGPLIKEILKKEKRIVKRDESRDKELGEVIIDALITGDVSDKQEKEIREEIIEEKIVIQEEENKSGKYLADHLTAEILKDETSNNSYLKGAHTKIFKVVEKEQLDKILEEQKLALSGLIDESTAAEVGKLLGADAIILGKITHTTTEDKSVSSLKNKEKQLIGKMYCNYRTVVAEVSMRVVSVATREILTSIKRKTRYGISDEECKKCPLSDEECNTTAERSNRLNLAEEKELLYKSLPNLAGDLAIHICPRFYRENFTIKKIKTKDHKTKSKEAINYLKRKEFGKAFSIYSAIQKVDPYNAETIYNMGVLFEIVGNYEKASEKYALARKIDESDKLYNAAELRIEQEKAELKELEKININVIPGDYEVKEEEALAEKIRTKGSSKKHRYDVYESASDKSKLVARIPGGTSFTVIKDAGKWVLIKLLGSKQGYISKKNIR